MGAIKKPALLQTERAFATNLGDAQGDNSTHSVEAERAFATNLGNGQGTNFRQLANNRIKNIVQLYKCEVFFYT